MDIPSYILGRIKGSGGAGVNYVVVEELPTVGEEGTIYLVPKEDSKTDNVYNEYMYIEDEWELIGDTQADLTDYVQKTDYATSETGGVIKISNRAGIYATSSGVLYASERSYNDYDSFSNNSFISKGTLENVIDGKGLITQYSTLPTASIDNLGKIAQYTGTTDSTYTNGYFYQVVSDGQDPATYSWENINVQASGGSSAPEYIIDTNGNKLYFVAIKNSDEINTILKSVVQKVVDDYENNIKSGIFILDITDYRNTGAYYISTKSGIQYLFVSNNNFVTKNRTNSYSDYYVSNIGFRASFSGTTITAIVGYGNPGTRIDIFCLETNVDYSQPYTPLYAGSPATKKYVDDTTLLKAYQLAGLSEYSSSSTYAVGDYVYYNNLIYKCSTAVSVAEAFDDTKWTQKTYMQYMSDTLVGTALGGSY